MKEIQSAQEVIQHIIANSKSNVQTYIGTILYGDADVEAAKSIAKLREIANRGEHSEPNENAVTGCLGEWLLFKLLDGIGTVKFAQLVSAKSIQTSDLIVDPVGGELITVDIKTSASPRPKFKFDFDEFVAYGKPSILLCHRLTNEKRLDVYYLPVADYFDWFKKGLEEKMAKNSCYPSLSAAAKSVEYWIPVEEKLMIKQ